MPGQREIVFECITPLDYPVLIWFCWRRESVAVFDFTCDLKKRFLPRWLINRGLLARIYVRPNTAEHGRAIDLAEQLAARVAGQPLLEICRSLYARAEIVNVFKKALLDDLFRVLYIQRYFQARGQRADILFFGRRFARAAALISAADGLPGYVRRPAGEKAAAVLEERLENFVLSVALLLRLLLLRLAAAFACLCGGKTGLPQSFRFAFIVHSLFQVESNGQRGFDAVLDDELVCARDSVFILSAPVPEALLAPYRRRGYVFYDMPSACSFSGLVRRRHAGVPVNAALRAAAGMFCGRPAQRSFVRAFCLCLNIFVRWTVTLGDVRFDRLAYTNDESAGQTAANILLSGRGVRIWNYACFLGGGYLYSTGDDFSGCRNVLWAFLCADHYAGMNTDACAYNRLHHQRVGDYIPVGSLYSQGIRELDRAEVKEKFLAERFPGVSTRGRKIVAFFDTTFIDAPEAMTTFDDCLAFYRDILSFLTVDQDVLVLIKPSKNLRRYRDPAAQWSSPQKAAVIAGLWKELGNSPRVCWAFAGQNNRSFLDFSMNNLVVAVSDLVVTHCMSSPAAEAWGAGKRAFWYESGDKHRGIRLDAVPGLIVHGRSGLFERTRDLLYRTSDDDHRQYLQRYVQGRVVAETRGQGMSAFRQMLIDEGGGRGSGR